MFQIALRISSSGRMRDSIDGEIVEMGFPNFLIKWPGKTYGTVSDLPFESFLVTYPPEAADFFRKAGFNGKRSNYEFHNASDLSFHLQRISSAVSKIDSIAAISRIDLYCLEFAQELMILADEYENSHKESEQSISAAADYIHLHYLEDIDFNDLAEKFGFSRRSFTRYWKTISHLPVAEYLKKLRLDYAKDKLISTNWSMEKIAYAIQYGSSAYFCDMFKRVTGISPHQYRLKMTTDMKNSRVQMSPKVGRHQVE